MDVATNRQVVPKLRMKGDVHPFLNLFYRCTVHFDICEVHTPTNTLFISFIVCPCNMINIYLL
jgi:hypothetical protein